MQQSETSSNHHNSVSVWSWLLPWLNLPRQRRRRFVLVTISLLLLAWLLYASWNALIPYVIGLFGAYLLVPLVNGCVALFPPVLRKQKIARPLAIVLVYLAGFGLFVLFIVALVPPFTAQMERLTAAWPSLLYHVKGLSRDLWLWYQENVPQATQQEISIYLEQIRASAVTAIQQGAWQALSVVTNTVSFILGIIVVPFWLFYVLNDVVNIEKRILQVVSAKWRCDVRNMAVLVDRVLSAYFRGQLLLGGIVGVMVGVGLAVLGMKDYAIVLGAVAGGFELIPYIGPILGAIPGVLLASLLAPQWLIWIIIMYIAVQQVENIFLVPRIAGKSVQLHPALIMVVLVIGNQLWGLLGMLLAVPVTAVLRDIFKYIYLRSLDEPLSPEEAMARVYQFHVIFDV